MREIEKIIEKIDIRILALKSMRNKLSAPGSRNKYNWSISELQSIKELLIKVK